MIADTIFPRPLLSLSRFLSSVFPCALDLEIYFYILSIRFIEFSLFFLQIIVDSWVIAIANFRVCKFL